MNTPETLSPEQLTALRNLYAIARRINALTSNPHWTSDRRWTIDALAAETTRQLRVIGREVIPPSIDLEKFNSK